MAGVAVGARTCMPTCVGIAHFVVVSEHFWEDGMGGSFFGIVRFVVVYSFLARFCVLQCFRTGLSDADVMRMQDIGAGIAFSWWFRSNVALLARPREGLKKSIRDGDSSIAATLVTSGS